MLSYYQDCILILVLVIHCSTEAEYEEKFQALKAKHAEELSGQTTTTEAAPPPPEEVDPEEEERQKRQEKARRKREKAREKEREKERQIEEETANAGPAPRQVESDMIQERLPPNWKIQEVAADGHCLYRAVGAQCGKEYTEIRTYCVVRWIKCSGKLQSLTLVLFSRITVCRYAPFP